MDAPGLQELTQAPVRTRTRSFDPQRWLATMLCDLNLWVCGGFVAFALLIPPDGIPGIELCAFRNITSLPCPGCGMSRAGANLFRGDVARSIDYHIFGIVVIPVAVMLAVMGVLPRKWRNAVRAALAPWALTLRRLFIVGLVAFLVFGLVRLAAVWGQWTDFPASWL